MELRHKRLLLEKFNIRYEEDEMNNRHMNSDGELSGISGLGGWLILIQISLWLALVFLISDVSQVNVIMDPARWK